VNSILLGSAHVFIDRYPSWSRLVSCCRRPSGSRRHVVSVGAALVLAVVQNHQYV